MKYTQKDYESAVEAAAKAWDKAEEIKSLCMNRQAEEHEVDEATEAAKKASEYTQHVYQNQE